MKVLLTGGTGFLGKYVLNLLIADSHIERIDVVTRSKATHPHPKVQLIGADLSDPTSLNQLRGDVDAVIHLAGLYDFRMPLPDNYAQNVLCSLNLMDRLKQWNETRTVPVFVASTYAVGFSSSKRLTDAPLGRISSRTNPYPYTKAVAERAFTDSGLPGAVFRLGVLVGTSTEGKLEKLDGPYAFLNFLLKYRKQRVSRLRLPLPIPGKRDGILPWVPVDYAAQIFHRMLFEWREKFQIYGVYNPLSVRVDQFVHFALESLVPGTAAIFMEKVPPRLLKLESRITGIPEGNFLFALNPIELGNSSFEIPHFDSYKENFLKGFLEFMGELPSPAISARPSGFVFPGLRGAAHVD